MSRIALPQNFIINQGDIIDDFETINNWSVVANGTREADTVHFKTGTQGIKLTNSVGKIGYTDKNITQDYNYNTIGLWVYIENLSKLGAIVIYLTTSNFAKYFIKSFNITVLVQGWNYLAIHKDEWGTDGTNESFENRITKCRIAVYAVSGEQAQVTFDDLRANVVKSPKLVICFDDGNSTDYTQAYSYMAPKGLKGTIYAIKSLIGRTGYNTTAQLTEMYNAGWAIGNHTNTHPDLTTLTQAEIESEITICRDWLLSLGFMRSYRHLSYPIGKRNATVDAAMAATGMLTGRLANNKYPVTIPINSFYTDINCVNVSATATLNSVKTVVDTIKNKGTTAFILFHKLEETPTGDNWSISDFQALIDYIVEKRIDCLTVDEFYNGLNNPRYRSLPLSRVTV